MSDRTPPHNSNPAANNWPTTTTTGFIQMGAPAANDGRQGDVINVYQADSVFVFSNPGDYNIYHHCNQRQLARSHGHHQAHHHQQGASGQGRIPPQQRTISTVIVGPSLSPRVPVQSSGRMEPGPVPALGNGNSARPPVIAPRIVINPGTPPNSPTMPELDENPFLYGPLPLSPVSVPSPSRSGGADENQNQHQSTSFNGSENGNGRQHSNGRSPYLLRHL